MHSKPQTNDKRFQQLLAFGLTEQQARDQIRNETLLTLLETSDSLEELKAAIRKLIDDKA